MFFFKEFNLSVNGIKNLYEIGKFIYVFYYTYVINWADFFPLFSLEWIELTPFLLFQFSEIIGSTSLEQMDRDENLIIFLNKT